MAEDAGALFECYLESPRSGALFAPTGSTVISGHHHNAWNYLHVRCEVHYVVLGQPRLFASSLPLMGQHLVQSSQPAGLYTKLLSQTGVKTPSGAALIPSGPITVGSSDWPIATYLYPDLCFGRQLGFTDPEMADAFPKVKRSSYFVENENWTAIDTLRHSDNQASICQRIFDRSRSVAKGVAFGDPSAILSQMAWHCRSRRVAFWGPRAGLPAAQVQVSTYTEDVSIANAAAGQAAQDLGVPSILGRQTCDGDLMAWSKMGVSMEIVDPCRPPLPVIEELPHPWDPTAQAVPLGPSDAQLESWADTGKQLACVMIHSGEIAHTEAMLLLCEMAERTGVALGLASCVGRYRTCPQQWELIATARSAGGFAGLVEPVLYGNGWGVMAEAQCGESMLLDGLSTALDEIRRIAGQGAVPRGHYSFLDTDLPSFGTPVQSAHRAYAQAGLSFDVSSAQPGRARIVAQSPGYIAINQSCRTIFSGSPYVRIQDPEDLGTSLSQSPGWLVATLDAPVVAFQPAIWDRGTRILELFRRIAHNRIAATPSTIVRYAAVLARRGLVPQPTVDTP
jgi:hypothetical protein